MKVLQFLPGLFIILLVISCRKDGASNEEDNNGNKMLTDIVPQAYLDKAKQMGFNIYTGNNPPDISGDWQLAPWRFDSDNYSEPGTGNVPGSVNQDGFTLRISEQSGTSVVARYVGYYEGTKALSKPFITGSGNDFTICRHIQMVGGMGGLFSYPYAQLISGSRNGQTLKNVKMATIGLKAETPNEAGLTVEGEISIRSDADGISQ